MEAKELRIGNRIDWSEFASMGLGQETVTIKNIVYHSLMKPIPLTEDWLLRFCFVFKEAPQRWVNPKFVGFEVTCYADGYFWLTFKGFQLPIRLDNVHELQNAFALTGEDLILK